MHFAAEAATRGLLGFVTLDAAIAATAVFVITYAVIAVDKLHKTVAALAGAVAVLVIGLVSQESAFQHVDWNVIFLLFGMMIIAGALRRAGVFQWMAIQAARWTRGDPVKLFVALVALTGVASALLDNVTTVVLIGPITIFLATRLGLSPVPYLVGEIFASNIGGTATLIGDPPNLMIGSATGLGFMPFLSNLAPIAVVLMIFLIVYLRFAFRRELAAPVQHREAILQMDARAAIVNPALARRSAIVLGLTIAGFVMHGFLNLEPATIALAGAAIIMIWGRLDPRAAFEDVEWVGLLFFVGLFIVVGALLETGVLATLAAWLASAFGGDPLVTSLAVLWFSGLTSGIVDNIPLAAATIPVIAELEKVMHIDPLWWSLALGAGVGGNLTAIGAATNVILITIAEREGHKITFRQFLLHGVPITLGMLGLCTLYVWGRYFALGG